MIQVARKPKSQSFLREMKDAILILPSEEKRNEFLSKFSKILQARQENPNTQNGFLSVKRQLQLYLKKFGNLKTANVWARNISLDEKDIINLQYELYFELLKNKCYGVAEIHLQDREINSPHIQYVGVNAELAEQIIALIIVKNSYELDMESALSKKYFKPYYQEDINPIVKDLETEITNRQMSKDIEEYKKDKRISKIERFSIDYINKLLENTKNQFKLKNNTENKIEKILQKYKQDKDLQNYSYKIDVKDLHTKIKLYKRRRKRKF